MTMGKFLWFNFLIISAFFLLVECINSVKQEIKCSREYFDLNFNHLVFRVDCLNPELDKKKVFRDYLDKVNVPESIKEKIWNEFLDTIKGE